MKDKEMIDQDAGLTEIIIGRIKAGDKASFDRLFLRYRERIIRVINIKMPENLKKQIEADDVLQEVWIKAYRNFSSFKPRGPGSFKGWILEVVRNCITDLIRNYGAKKRAIVAREMEFGRKFSDSFMTLAEKISDSTKSVSSKVRKEEEYTRIRSAIESLPETQRNVMKMRYINGLSIAESSNCLGISEAAVKMASLRGLKKLSEILRI